MSPVSGAFIALLVAAAVGMPVVVGLLAWLHHRGRPGRLRHTALMAGMAIIGQLATIVCAAAVVNAQLGLYPTWTAIGDSLTTGTADLPPLANAGPQPLTPAQEAALNSGTPNLYGVQPPSGDGSYLEYVITGTKSHTKDRVLVWIPPGYTTSTVKGLPAVMMLEGAYNHVDWFFRSMHIGEVAGPLIRAHQLKPFVLVAPELNIALPDDTECFDFPRGPQAWTWLASDVPAWAHTHLGVAATGWGVMGWSVGGYCSAKLAVAVPGTFSSGANIQGYLEPEPDTTTGPLSQILAASKPLRRSASVTWMVQHQRPKNLRLLIATGPDDPQSWPHVQAFLAKVGTVPGITVLTWPGIGHVVGQWADQRGPLLQWLLGGVAPTKAPTPHPVTAPAPPPLTHPTPRHTGFPTTR